MLVINGREPLGLGVDGPQALLEDDGGHMAVLVHLQFLGTPAIVDLDIFFQSLGNLIVGGRHGSPILQADHGDLGSAEALGSLGTVNGHVAAADDHHIALHLLVLVLQSMVQELHSDGSPLGGIIGNAGTAAALAADGDVEGLIALLAQLGDGHILADFHAALDLHTQLPDDLDLGVDDVLLQLEGGDAVGQHTAGLGALFKDRGPLVAR